MRRAHKPSNTEFVGSLREGMATPKMDNAQVKIGVNPFLKTYCNWPSVQQVNENRKSFSRQRESIDRLSQSPNRISPLAKYLNAEATIDKDPREKPRLSLVNYSKRSYSLVGDRSQMNRSQLQR